MSNLIKALGRDSFSITDDFFSDPMSFEGDLLKFSMHIKDLRKSLENDDKIQPKIASLEEELKAKIVLLYQQLSPIQKVEISRHPKRPHGLEYINRLCKEFVELCGDRHFGEDKSIISGLAKINNHSVIIIAHERGHDTESRKIHNFGMPLPEGYRKARRMMYIARDMKIPIVCLIDTPGAYPGITSEERGQGSALADCLAAAIEVEVPIFSCVIGEGGSGGAIALGVANVVIMLEHAIYSVISPEGCASILWKAKDKRAEAAVAQKLTAQDLHGYGLIDMIIPEPFGGAHRDPFLTIDRVGHALDLLLNQYANKDLYYRYLRERINRNNKVGNNG